MSRFYGLSYEPLSHLQIARQNGILGVNFEGSPNYLVPFGTLRPGDIILLRNAESKDRLRFYAHCVVTHAPHIGTEPLWPDEVARNSVLYPNRVHVDFDDVPPLPGLYAHDWDDWLNLGWVTVKGEPYNKQKLAVVLHGRYLPPGASDELSTDSESYHSFLEFLGTAGPAAGAGFRQNVAPGDSAEVGQAGERCVYELLRRRYSGPGQYVDWVSQRVPTSPFDIQITEHGRVLLYVEVKATIRKGPVAIGYISSGEWKVREQYPSNHELYFVVFNGRLDDPHPAIYLVQGDCRVAPVKWRIEFPLERAVPVRR